MSERVVEMIEALQDEMERSGDVFVQMRAAKLAPILASAAEQERELEAHVNAAFGAAVEACAKLGIDEISGERPKDNWGRAWVSGIKHYVEAIRSLGPEAATEELEHIVDDAKEAALPLACKAIIESLDGGEFSSASPLAQVKAELERRTAEAERKGRLEEILRMHNPNVHYPPIPIGHSCGTCQRIAELTAAAKETP